MMVVKAPLPLQLVPCPSPSSSSSRKSNRSFTKKCVSNYRVFVVRSSYSSKPLKTAGAYQLVDDETGEKLIVWGGAGDEPSIPPNHLLHSSNWNPNPSQQTAGSFLFKLSIHMFRLLSLIFFSPARCTMFISSYTIAYIHVR